METSHDRAVSSQKSLDAGSATAPSDLLNLLLADGSDIIVTANRDGIIQSVTDTVTDILGYMPAELIGRHIGGFVNPTEVEQAQEIFDNSVRVPGHRDPIERGLLHVDGTRRVCEVISTNLLHVPEVAAMVFHVRDISRRLVAQQRFRQMFETHPTATAYIPTNGRGVLANPAYAELFGWTVVQLQTIKALDLAHPNSRQAIRARIAAGGGSIFPILVEELAAYNL